jgi:uncharacterized protein YqeY
MSLIEKINEDFMVAYKAKEMEKKDFLGVLKTEVTKESKTPEDSYVVAKIKSMIKNAEATNSLSETELNILNTYLPTQLDQSDLDNLIRSYVSDANINNPKEMGKVMTWLKSNYDGQYDGKVASTIIKEVLALLSE